MREVHPCWILQESSSIQSVSQAGGSGWWRKRDASLQSQHNNMKTVRRMMSKEIIQRNNSFAAFSAAEPGSLKSRSRTKSADAFRPTRNQTSILKENADKLGQLAQVRCSYINPTILDFSV